MVTLLCRRHPVEKSGSGQSKPASPSRLATMPIVCRSARPNRTLIDRQNWMAASEKVSGLPGRPRFGASHSVSRSSYNATLRRRGSLLVWLDRKTEWLAHVRPDKQAGPPRELPRSRVTQQRQTEASQRGGSGSEGESTRVRRRTGQQGSNQATERLIRRALPRQAADR